MFSLIKLSYLWFVEEHQLRQHHLAPVRDDRRTRAAKTRRRLSSRDCFEAATAGDLEGLKLAVQSGCSLPPLLCPAAAQGGNLACLVYVHEVLRQPLDKRTCELAALSGSLECLRYARENGCPWDVRTCHFAAYHGHVHILAYARANGNMWDMIAVQLARDRGHLKCLSYMICPRDDDDFR